LREVMAYEGDPQRLAPPERLFRDVAQIAFIEQRLRAATFQADFTSVVAHVKETLCEAHEAIEVVQRCDPLKRLLRWVLAIGNAMNDGYFGAQAQAFSLSSLLKLADVKDTKGEGTNLLAHLLRQVEQNDPTLLPSLQRELAPCLTTSLKERLSLAVEEVAVLSDGLRQIERLVFEIQPKTKWETTTTKKRKSVFSSCLRGPTNKGKNTNNLMKEQEDEEDGDPLKNTPQLPGQDEEEEEEEEGEQEEEEDRFYLAARAFTEEARPVVVSIQKEAEECRGRFGELALYLCEAHEADVIRILHDFSTQLQKARPIR